MKRSRTSILLIEIMIAILFLSISIAVCVQLFVAAHLKGEESNDRNTAVFQAQTIADTFNALDGNINELAAIFEFQEESDDYTAYYNTDGEFTSTTEKYYVVITPKEDGTIISLNMDFFVTGEDIPIYNLHTSMFIGGQYHE